jgi:predicted RND superfamily exporter protein
MVKPTSNDWAIFSVLGIVVAFAIWNIIFPNQFWKYYLKSEKRGDLSPDLGTGNKAMLYGMAKSKNRHRYSIYWSIGMIMLVALILLIGFSKGGAWHYVFIGR